MTNDGYAGRCGVSRRRFARGALAISLSGALGGVCAPTAAQVPSPPGSGDFELDFNATVAAWPGPPIRIFGHRPATADSDAPLVFVMHGVARGGRGYRDAWRPFAAEHGFIVAAPRFSREGFPGADGYQIGASEAASASSHAAIEPMFDFLRARLDLAAETYAMYGHSAGSQFTHRFLFRTGGPRLARAVCANAGWYFRPDTAYPFPYGLTGAHGAAAGLDAALAKPVTVLLGTADLGRDGSLRQTPEAEAQGPHRVARGRNFFAAAEARAEIRGVPFGWRLAFVDGVGHSNRRMAPAAAQLLADAKRASHGMRAE